MSRITYTPQNFQGKSLAIIQQANAICAQYQQAGYDLTLRQLYYQFVSRGLIPNKDTEYKRLGSIINDARLAGMLDWDYITDRTRNMQRLARWDDPADALDAIARQYREDLWADQDEYVEVWVEKDALSGVVAQACDPLRVPYLACRGYMSQSEMWASAQRFLEMDRAGKRCHLLHLGDHDPSGIDMSRDIQDRLDLFAPNVVQVNRIALTMAQVNQYNPPPNPAKLTDSRGSTYVATYGYSSWELDALDPADMTTLIEDEVALHRDDSVWASSVQVEDEHREQLTYLSDHYPALNARWYEVTELVDDEEGSNP
jgi:hypothetical protein